MENSRSSQSNFQILVVAEITERLCKILVFGRVPAAERRGKDAMKTKRVMKLHSGILFLLLLLATTWAKAQVVTTLYSFTNSGGDGAFPYAGLIMDPSGNLYGTTIAGGASYFGTVFELVNKSGNYTENVLHSFTNSNGDGASPYAGLVMDSSGNLYGTTNQGGGSSNCASGCGTVFELVNNSGTYTENVLHRFTKSNGDGALPYEALVMDSSGNLYGTTIAGGAQGLGTLFESNPAPDVFKRAWAKRQQHLHGEQHLHPNDHRQHYGQCRVGDQRRIHHRLICRPCLDHLLVGQQDRRASVQHADCRDGARV